MSLKGCFDGECNRAACKNTGVRYYNKHSHGYYCADCAKKIDNSKEIWEPPSFDWPQKPDEHDRHLVNKSQQKYRDNHPDIEPEP